MMPIDFEGANFEFVKPDNMTDEQCMPVRAFVGIDNDGFDFTLLAFQPSREDLIAFNSGRPLMLKIIMRGMPPVALYTLDENFEANV